MSDRYHLYSVLSVIVLTALLISPLQPVSLAAGNQRSAASAHYGLAPIEPPTAETGLYRTRVSLADPAARARLDKLGARVLDEGADWAELLVDGDQLETLARLRFEPRGTDELGPLIAAYAAEKPWLAESVRPLLGQAATVQAQRAAAEGGAAATVDVQAVDALRAAVQALTPEQAAGVAGLISNDTDGDGLTNTQESWWCTDPAVADTDNDGRTDGAEIQALKDWMANRRAGPPGETPWPNWPFNTTTCPDKDHDSIPNLAERWELGLNMDLESSDRDKFDDGQELFGVTYCPGGDLSCGYGDLPRSADSGYVGAAMPSWVKAPGKHPLVAAFPVPEVDVIESSLHVQTVTTVTTDHTIASGTEKSYSTAKTEGTSTSVADTVTWNDWQETSTTVPLDGTSSRSVVDPTFSPSSTDAGPGTLISALSLGTTLITEPANCVYQELQGELSGCGKIYDRRGELKSAFVGAARDTLWNESQPVWKRALNLAQCLGPTGLMTCATKVAGGFLARNHEMVLKNHQQDPNATTDRGDEGNFLSYNAMTGNVTVEPVFQISVPQLSPPPTRTETTGKSWGGAQTTTHAQYEEQTITNGEAFSNEESWGDATAADSAHSADLWFTYKVRNTGTEYAREIAGLAFNLYIGDSPDPAYTYFVGPDLGGDGAFHNFMPAEEHTYTARHIPLTLEQMKQIDLGGPVRVVLEDYTYGADELFYQDAAGAGVLLAMEDGTDDGDEAIDSYLIPTWGSETVLDVLARYFPNRTDADGSLIAIWTPEYRSDVPAWCAEPNVVGSGAQTTVWCKHALSTADWWNIYTDGMGDGSEGFQDTPASPGQVALFRFNQDSDLDGYSDRSEARLGTDPHDPASFPRPELLAGVHSIRSGSHVVATLSLVNTGLYDAYGVEAVMIAPNDSISITNNTVGGSGRVRAQKQVIVGSRILTQTPLPATWLAAGHAQPTAGGYYEGQSDRTYTFTVSCASPGGCSVGSGTWSLGWNDGAGASGSLSFGAGYQSPALQAVGALGLQMGLLSGTVANGESFTVAARTPRDTFQYEIAAGHESDFTPPIVIVSYNDPQGNHRFAVPPAAMALASPTTDLMAFSGEMLTDPGVEIVTSAAFAAGANTTDLVVNNPTEATLTGAHLFLEFIDPDGNVVLEVPVTTAVPAGPGVVPVAWNSGSFSPAYDPAKDYIVMAFWTDYQGNILDTAARPLSSFQEDPKPASAMANAEETWNFGTAQQGTLMQRTFTLGSTGYADLLTHLGAAITLTVAGSSSRAVAPGDTAIYTVTLKTENLPVGEFNREIKVRTSDPSRPERTIAIHGNVTPMPPDAPGGATIRPLDWTVTITGAHNAGDWVEFTHSLGPEPQSLHPVKVYSQDYLTLDGAGRYATDFVQGTVSGGMFGDGRDGDLVVQTGQTVTINTVRVSVTAAGSVAAPANSSGFSIGDTVILHQTQGTADVGRWELNQIAAITPPNNWTLAKPLMFSYDSTNGHAQVVKVPQYRNVTVNPGGLLTAPSWDGSAGGILAFRCSGALIANGAVSVDGVSGSSPATDNTKGAGAIGGGFRGGNGSDTETAYTGEGIYGGLNIRTTSSGQGQGGGGTARPAGNWPSSGGGGGYLGTGGTGQTMGSTAGQGGLSYGVPDLVHIFPGSGGGGGAYSGSGASGGGGSGGGIAFLFAMQLANNGAIRADGGNGGNGHYPYTTDTSMGGMGGGGGSGGSVFVSSQNATIGDNRISVNGGSGGSGNRGPGGAFFGGGGSQGRIRIEYCDALTGTTTPPASAQKLNCHIVEQVESDPQSGLTRLNLPESTPPSHTYQVQFGRRIQFAGSGQQTPSISMPKQLYASASLDALVNNTGISSGPLTLALDVGNDGTYDWTRNANTSFPATIPVTGFVSALNAYLVSRGDVAWGADVDVPVRVQMNRQADVLLTNLVLTLQFNQPHVMTEASVNTGADRPLDVPVFVPGNRSQGDPYDFTHTLGPDSATIQPCMVYDQGGSVLKGVGKYCGDFGQGTASYEIFGDGHDGDLTVRSGQTAYLPDIRYYLVSRAESGQPNLVLNGMSNYSVGMEVMVFQTQGVGAGQYEFATIVGISGTTMTLDKNLIHAYEVSGNSRAQVVFIPHYRNVTVESGATLSFWGWGENGPIGGVLAFRANGSVSINGNVDMSGKGFRGTPSEGGRDMTGKQGEGDQGGYNATRATARNGSGGGGGQGTQASGGGGGGGNAEAGENGGIVDGHIGGTGGHATGNSMFDLIFLGGGGGQGGFDDDGNTPGAGGSGAGVLMIFAESLSVSAPIHANGANGGDGNNPPTKNGMGGGGGGAGGSVLIVGKNLDLGTGAILATGGSGGNPGGGYGGRGGNGSAGRIRIEYQNMAPGWSTNPPASTQQVYFYIAEQGEGTPATTRLYLPDSFPNGQAYLVQYGRRFAFGAAGQLTNTLRLKGQVYGAASLDVLVSNAGVSSGNLNLCLDLGNDGVCDYSYSNPNATLPATLTATGLDSALNAYLLAHNAVTGGGLVDVPVRVQIDRQAEVMLANLALDPVGAKTRFLRLPARGQNGYSDVRLSLRFEQPGVPSGPLAFTVDVGADGTIDWSDAGTRSFPAVLTSGNLQDAFNAYLAPRSGDVDVPIRIVPSPSLPTSLESFTAVPSQRPDLVASAPEDGGGPIVEGDTITLRTNVNSNGAEAGPFTASFFATSPTWGPTYLGTGFVPGGSGQATISWNTTGFTGTVPVRVVVDPFNRVAETNERNNVVTSTLTILSRPDLSIPAIALSDPEPVTGQAVTVTLTERNAGQTAAGTHVMALYDGNPDGGGTQVCQWTPTAPAGGQAPLACTWTPTSPGPHRLFARADRAGQVGEYDEGNNDVWLDTYVGFVGPILLDSGATGDAAYTPAAGYGFLDEGQSDVLGNCGSEASQTYRLDPGGAVVYRFDHLLPGHYYHLDTVLYECGQGAGRQEYVRVDGNTVAGPADLGDGKVHRSSVLLDPALYADRSIRVTVEAYEGLGTVANEVALYDVDYRYADSGSSARDPQYPYVPPGTERAYGWLDGSTVTTWGTLPYQSGRVDLNDNEVRYRFDGLDPRRRYQLHLTFYQGSGANRVQQAWVNGQPLGQEFTIVSGQRISETLAIPLSGYASDGSIVAAVRRSNATVGALVNEIALEEETQAAAASCDVPETPFFTLANGAVTLSGQPALAGTVVTAESPRGDLVGCFVVGAAGLYGFMPVYGEDLTANPAIPGMREGEEVIFRVNGALAVPSIHLGWQDDKAPHRVDLAAGITQVQSILLGPGWNNNLFSFSVEPPVPTVEAVLASIAGKYCRVLSETGIYDCNVPERFRTLKELHAKWGYYVRVEGGASANLLVEGVPIEPTTPIPLHVGWNWVGYLPTSSLPVATAVASIAGHYLWITDGSGFYDPSLPQYSTLTQMAPGHGYLIYATDSVSLIYPGSSGEVPEGEIEGGPRPSTPCPEVQQTPFFTIVYGDVTPDGNPAAAGARVEVVTPRGDVAGCFTVEQAGQYGFLMVYGEDPTANPPIPGFRSDEPLAVRVDGEPVTLSRDLLWNDDKMPHRLDLGVGEAKPIYLPLVVR